MKVLFILMTALLMLPAFPKDKGAYMAKKEKALKKKDRRKRVRYPVRVNPNGEELKIKEMLKDIYE